VRQNFIPLSTVLVRRSLVVGLGGFEPRYRIACDYDLWLRLSREAGIDFIDRPLAMWRVHGTNLTRDFGAAYRENESIYRALAATDDLAETAGEALAELYWKWALREALSGEGTGPALRRLRQGVRASGGPARSLGPATRFALAQLRGLPLRVRIAIATSRGSPGLSGVRARG
jgi:hypothetical protein